MRKGLIFIFVLGVALLPAGCGSAKKTEAGSDAVKGGFHVFVESLPGCDGITIDHSGHMYVGSRHTNELYRVDPDGEAVKFADMPCSELL